VRDWVYNFDYDPKPAMKTLEDLETRFAVGQVFVGGHSQGAYYTFLLVTKFPERFAGACPFAGGLLKGCDPKSAANRKGKPGPPVAIIHGEADPVVDAELSDWAYEIFAEAEWPRLRYFHPADLNHMFLMGPVKPAIDWMMAMASEDGAELVATAERLLQEDRGSDAFFCVERAIDLKTLAPNAGDLKQKPARRNWPTPDPRMKEKGGAWSGDLRRPGKGASLRRTGMAHVESCGRSTSEASKWSREAGHTNKNEKGRRELFAKTSKNAPPRSSTGAPQPASRAIRPNRKTGYDFTMHRRLLLTLVSAFHRRCHGAIEQRSRSRRPRARVPSQRSRGQGPHPRRASRQGVARARLLPEGSHGRLHPRGLLPA
jgi:pimeloyl-ACP methyl ester carboxylesterase